MDAQTVIATLASALSGRLYRGLPTPPVPPLTQDPDSAITMYRVLRALYDQNGLYDQLAYLLNQVGTWHEAILPLRNPANRVAEFYAAKLWPGANLDDALPIEDAPQAIIDAIQQVWTWSNWASQKQVAARWLAIYGDLFLKVVARQDPARVTFQLLQPETATQIDADDRGFLTYLRLDVPVVDRLADGTQKQLTVTEVWDKAADSLRIWRHDKGSGTEIRALGTPNVMQGGIREETGVDFIPVVHTRFRDTGDLRGSGAYTHAIDKLNEANRMATRLNQMLFRHNKVTWALQANMMTGDNRPMPPVQVGESSSRTATPTNLVSVGDDEMYRLPGMSTLTPLVPNLQYDAALRILQDHMTELERDLPELAYYRLREIGAQLSGRAVRLLLSDAVDKVVEARGNAQAGLIRADQMALTIGNVIGALRVNGSFEAGSFDHSFRDRPVIPTSDLEDAQASLAEAQAGLAWEQLGVSKEQWLRDHGYSEDQIAQMAAEKQAAADTFGTQLLDAVSRGQLNGQPN